MKCEVVNTKLGEIEYSSIGKGIPILFIHGGHSNCKESISHKGFDLDIFQLITPSRPGYGNTPLGNNKTPREAADIIIELLDYLSIDNVIVYGISAGGLTAIELASSYPDRVSKLVLASAISKKWLNENGQIYKIAKRIFNPKVEKYIWGLVRFFSKIFPSIIAKSFYSQFSKSPTHKLTKIDTKEFISTMKSFNSKMGFVNDIDQKISSESIIKIKCDTLIIHSKNDNSVSIEHAKYSNRMIENSTIEILNNEWGHMFWIGNDSEESIRRSINFIQN